VAAVTARHRRGAAQRQSICSNGVTGETIGPRCQYTPAKIRDPRPSRVLNALARWWRSRPPVVYVATVAAVVAAVVMTAPSISLEELGARILYLAPLEGLLLLQLPVLLLAIAVHELGDVLAGLAAGFGPESCRMSVRSRRNGLS
jgi:hypothetical protein